MTVTDLITPDDVADTAPLAEDPAEVAAEEGVDKPATRAVDARLDLVDGRLAELTIQLGSAGTAVESALARSEAAEKTGAEALSRSTGAEGRLDAADAEARSTAYQVIDIVDRLATVDRRLDHFGDQLAAVKTQQAEHDRALTEVTRTIATEVERHTTDALVDTQHGLQLAVNSIAQLSLAMAESSRDLTDDVSAESATVLLDSFRVDLDAILGQLGFAPLNTIVGTSFDPRRHRALKRVATPEPALDRVITRVIRDGYLSTTTGRVLLFADVEVSSYRT